MHFKHESEALHCHDNEGSEKENNDSRRGMDESAGSAVDDDDSDADIIEEADKRSKFMMKGGSHSIQKVLRGEARDSASGRKQAPDRAGSGGAQELAVRVEPAGQGGALQGRGTHRAPEDRAHGGGET